jgi:VanZ family protein
MSETGPQNLEPQAGWIHSTRLHVLLYSFLLIATPFIMLREYMQEAIGQLTQLRIDLAGLDIVIVPWAVLVLVIALLIYVRAHLTRLRILAGIVALLLIAFAQQITDYYFDHTFYDLQQNWHYLAYGGFAFMLYRDLVPRGIPPAKIILITFACALLFSSFDEGFQWRMSSRTFDTSDIAKDGWGAVIGMSLLYLGENPTGALLRNWRPLRHPTLRGYFTHPFSALLLCFLFVLSLLSFSSVLSESRYTLLVAAFAIAGFAVLFLILHVSQFRWGRRVFLAILALLVLVQGYFFLRYRDQNMVHNQPGLIVYKGIPVPFFDVMIRPDGRLRIVDRKKYFYARDRQFFMKQRPDILVIGSGANGTGGRGFPKEEIHQFDYNPNLERGTQVIVLPNGEACRVFNRLKKERKNVLFVLHSTE